MSFISTIGQYRNPNSIGSRFRKRRLQLLMALIDRCFDEKGSCTIIDIGGSPAYWAHIDSLYLDQRNVSVIIVNLQPMEPCQSDRFDLVIGDGCNLHNVRDAEFDIAHSNSVIEHVGDWNRVEAFAGEVRRVSSTYFVQTPNFWFPIEPHFGTPMYQFLPEPLRVKLLLNRSLGWYEKANDVAEATRAVQEIHLLNRQQFAAVFPDGEIWEERIGPFTKSFIAIRGDIGSVADFGPSLRRSRSRRRGRLAD